MFVQLSLNVLPCVSRAVSNPAYNSSSLWPNVSTPAAIHANRHALNSPYSSSEQYSQPQPVYSTPAFVPSSTMAPITYPPTTPQIYQPYREENPCQQCQTACMNECQAAGQSPQQCQQICQQNCQSACGQQPQPYQPYAEANQCDECQNQCHQQCLQQGAQNCDQQCSQQCQAVCQTTSRPSPHPIAVYVYEFKKIPRAEPGSAVSGIRTTMGKESWNQIRPQQQCVPACQPACAPTCVQAVPVVQVPQVQQPEVPCAPACQPACSTSCTQHHAVWVF
ncbi:unnamed protein product [Haemonchus placei]|uniref:TNFR-Cys domain-containing protein n=1 Tax=Haemonchus placei TaxID=6290 RepID=A0A0N4W8C3_HAEPC|nr:unnamed protein product [Haemonchus placei]